MKKFVLFNFLLLLLFGCKDDTNMIKCKGIPDINQAFAYMYFKTEYEGYLFGTYTEYEELSEKELENPNNIPKSTDEANIYKTIDGGKNWVKINSSLNYSYFNIGTQLNDYILKSATKPLKVLIAFTRPLITEFADNLNLKHPLLPTISPYPTM